MRKYAMILALILLLGMTLGGCRRNTPAETGLTTQPATTNPSTTTVPPTTVSPTGGTAAELGSTAVLEKIWREFGEEERFSVYGGTVENAVMDGPGPLNMANTDELTTSYLLPREQLANIHEASSLVHMMNSNVFTAVAVKVADGASLQESWRNAIQRNQWICGQPDRLLMASVEQGYLVMAFGSADAMSLFEGKLTAVFPQAEILYNEAIVS